MGEYFGWLHFGSCIRLETSGFVAPELDGILFFDNFGLLRSHVSLPGSMAMWNRLGDTIIF